MSSASGSPARFGFRRGRSNIYGIVDRPAAKLYVRSERGVWLPHYMLVDSGADFTLVPKAVGEILGFRSGQQSACTRPEPSPAGSGS